SLLLKTSHRPCNLLFRIWHHTYNRRGRDDTCLLSLHMILKSHPSFQSRAKSGFQVSFLQTHLRVFSPCLALFSVWLVCSGRGGVCRAHIECLLQKSQAPLDSHLLQPQSQAHGTPPM